MKYVALSHYTRIENKYIKTYAIVVLKCFVPIKIVKDVWTDGDVVRELVVRLNEHKVELVHLYDVIEDFYFEQM